MSIKKYLKSELCKRKAVQPCDVVKLCYQAAFGAEHLIYDIESARKKFFSEYESTKESAEELYTMISDEYARVNIGAWKRENLDPGWLFSLFLIKKENESDKNKLFTDYLNESVSVVSDIGASEFSVSAQEYLQEYLKDGIRAVHHSDAYKRANSPSYRIVCAECVRLIPILLKISSVGKRPLVITLEGRAASGKTTSADILSRVLGASVIAMDDFFLPPVLRTEERYKMPGGNIHYERFKEEVVDKLCGEKEFSYGKFSCSAMEVVDSVTYTPSDITVIEGVYSQHPYFGNYSDVRVFCSVDKSVQKERINRRNGVLMADKFEKIWIPLEEKYFEEFEVMENSDIVI